jgi:hypothetical protein
MVVNQKLQPNFVTGFVDAVPIPKGGGDGVFHVKY